MQTSKYRGVTLIEIVLVLGIFAAVAAALLPFAISQISQSRVEEKAKNIKSYMDYYQRRALTSDNDSGYGISFSSTEVTYFAGDSLATATETYVEELGDGVEIDQINLSNSATEIVFAQGTTIPDEYGSIRMSDGTSTYQISINMEGFIEITRL
jgi:type II secretory pathway pseudopilin PulG